MKKDKGLETESNHEKLAKTISFVFTPAIAGTFILLYSIYVFSPTREIFYKSFAAVFFFSIVLPVVFTLYLVRKKKIANFHIKERKERAIPFAFALVSSAFSLLAIKYIGANPELTRMFLILYLMGLGYAAITLLKFKISGHTFVSTSAMVVLTAFSDLRFIYLLPLIALIGWARVSLKEHTVGETIGGAIYAIISFILFSLLISN